MDERQQEVKVPSFPEPSFVKLFLERLYCKSPPRGRQCSGIVESDDWESRSRGGYSTTEAVEGAVHGPAHVFLDQQAILGLLRGGVPGADQGALPFFPLSCTLFVWDSSPRVMPRVERAMGELGFRKPSHCFPLTVAVSLADN